MVWLAASSTGYDLRGDQELENSRRSFREELQRRESTPLLTTPIDHCQLSDLKTLILRDKLWTEYFKAAFGEQRALEVFFRDLEAMRHRTAHFRAVGYDDLRAMDVQRSKFMQFFKYFVKNAFASRGVGFRGDDLVPNFMDDYVHSVSVEHFNGFKRIDLRFSSRLIAGGQLFSDVPRRQSLAGRVAQINEIIFYGDTAISLHLWTRATSSERQVEILENVVETVHGLQSTDYDEPDLGEWGPPFVEDRRFLHPSHPFRGGAVGCWPFARSEKDIVELANVINQKTSD
jgi:hypothetical protein